MYHQAEETQAAQSSIIRETSLASNPPQTPQSDASSDTVFSPASLESPLRRPEQLDADSIQSSQHSTESNDGKDLGDLDSIDLMKFAYQIATGMVSITFIAN